MSRGKKTAKADSIKHRAPDRPAAKLAFRPRNAKRTRSDIMRVATREFAERGFHGGRVDEIAEKTETSKRMLYYYYGSKEGLYQSVILNHYQKLRGAEIELNLDSKPPLQALEQLIRFTFDWYLENADDVPLVMEENIQKGRNIAKLPQLESLNSKVISLVERICKRGVAEGLIRPEVVPIELYMSIAAVSFFNVSNRYTFSRIFGYDMAAAGSIKSRRLAVIEMILRYVATDPAKVAKPAARGRSKR